MPKGASPENDRRREVRTAAREETSGSRRTGGLLADGADDLKATPRAPIPGRWDSRGMSKIDTPLKSQAGMETASPVSTVMSVTPKAPGDHDSAIQ